MQSSSFPKVSEQIISYNNNVLELLSKFSTLATSNQNDITVRFTDAFNVLQEYKIPSFNFLKSEIERLNNNINTLYSINEKGALVQGADNKFKKIILADLNRDPSTISSLNVLTSFQKKKNYFFDSLINPSLNVYFDLNGKVEDNVRKCQVRRYIVSFISDVAGNITPEGQAALNSFNDKFRGKNDINIDDFEYWYQTTPGIVGSNDPDYDEQVFDLDPNVIKYDGIFDVLEIEDDPINRTRWYHTNTLEYINTISLEKLQLKINDELIVNTEFSNTRYKIIEISQASSNPRLKLERIEGNQPIPVLRGSLKLYSPVVNDKKLGVTIDYNQRNVIFMKAMNADNHLTARYWSKGVGFFSNDLTLLSDDDLNGSTMESFYKSQVLDYGKVLKDIVDKKIPTDYGQTPNVAVLNVENFQVKQINKHITDSSDVKAINTKYNQQKELKSEIQQLNEAIQTKNKESITTNFKSKSDENKFKNELKSLIDKKSSKTQLLASNIADIVSLSNSPTVKDSKPKFRVRGFWDIPEPIVSRGSRPQEVIAFKIQYKYTSKDGKDSPVEMFKLTDSSTGLSSAAFSNWIDYTTPIRKREKDSSGKYSWVKENLADSEQNNINQLDITINPNEIVEFRVKSISEIGYPDNSLESDWSNTVSIEFPDELISTITDSETIARENLSESLRVNVQNDLNSLGLDEHLSDTATLNDKKFYHNSDKIYSGFKDENGVAQDIYEYLQFLTNKIKNLEDKLNNAKGSLRVVLFNGTDEVELKNNQELNIPITCENYCEEYNETGAPTGRVYTNQVYTIKDYSIRISNPVSTSPLGLLSNRTYFVKSDFFDPNAPQTFWVNDRDEMIISTNDGKTKTQLNNQFIWQANYTTSGNDGTTVKIAENIGNNFDTNTNNTITDQLASTQYNIGYSEPSILNFYRNNFSMLDITKWIDKTPNVNSNTKLLTSIHPVIQKLDEIVETNSKKVRSIDSGVANQIEIPINIYFKMNSLDPEKGTGKDYTYVNLNINKTNVTHIKRVKFFMENEALNQPFVFNLKFTMTRSRKSSRKIAGLRVNLN